MSGKSLRHVERRQGGRAPSDRPGCDLRSTPPRTTVAEVRPRRRPRPRTPRTPTRCSSGPAERRGERSEEHTSELQSRGHLVCRLLLEKKKTWKWTYH